jgi:predicted permease
VGSGLFARSLSTVRDLDLGLEPDRVLTMRVRWAEPASPAGMFTDEGRAAERSRRVNYYAEALERVRDMPGVTHAAVAIGTPFHSSFTMDLRVSGHDTIPFMAAGGPYVSAVTAGFFETGGLDILEGRSFTTADRAGSEPVAIVNRTMADRLWPGGALDQCVYLIEDMPDAPCSRIVGVVEDARRFGLRELPAMQYYIPNGQERGMGGELLLIRPAGPTNDPGFVESLRTALLDLDPGLSFIETATLQEEVDPQVRPWKLGATLFSLFGGLALLIASIGLYSVIAYMVADRTHEVGVRKALGADAVAVLLLIVRQGLQVVLIGLLFGAALALVAGRFIEPALFETSARDPLVFAGVAGVTIACALAASIVPALRAGRVDPVVALKTE